MARFEHLVFVCTNEGRANDTKARCGKQGAAALLEALKACAALGNKPGRIRVTRSGCLDLCARGCAAFVRSPGRADGEAWYIHLKPGDAARLYADITGELPPAGSESEPPLRTL